MTSPTLDHPQAPSAGARRLAARIAPRAWADDAYLAGSAALALYVGHRPVAGLDVMSTTNRLRSPDRRDVLEDVLALVRETGGDEGEEAGAGLGAAQVETARDGYLAMRVGDVPLRLYYYPYPLIAPIEEWRVSPAAASAPPLAVASAVDLGLMKLGAIISRGTRRDFVDLYLLSKRLPLAEILERSPEKFGHVRDFPLQALKGLADRSLTAGEPMPKLNEPLAWDEVEAWLDAEVRRLGRAHAGIEGAGEAGVDARSTDTKETGS